MGDWTIDEDWEIKGCFCYLGWPPCSWCLATCGECCEHRSECTCKEDDDETPGVPQVGPPTAVDLMAVINMY